MSNCFGAKKTKTTIKNGAIFFWRQKNKTTIVVWRQKKWRHFWLLFLFFWRRQLGRQFVFWPKYSHKTWPNCRIFLAPKKQKQQSLKWRHFFWRQNNFCWRQTTKQQLLFCCLATKKNRVPRALPKKKQLNKNGWKLWSEPNFKFVLSICETCSLQAPKLLSDLFLQTLQTKYKIQTSSNWETLFRFKGL